MDQNNSTPFPPPTIPVPMNDGSIQEPKKKSPLLFFGVIASVVVVVFAGIVLFQTSQTARDASVKVNPKPQPLVAPTDAPVSPRDEPQEIFPIESANPFEEPEGYENPFAEATVPPTDYQNPFTQ